MSPDDVSRDDLMWLVGLLEGEVSFIHYIHRQHLRIVISLRMTDYDVVERAGNLIGSSRIYTLYDPRPNNSVIYRVSVEGLKALVWMKKLYPLMGIRRKDQIKVAIERFEYYRANLVNKKDKVGYDKAELIRKAWREDENISQSQLAKRFGITQACVSRIVRNESYIVKGDAY